MEQFLASIEKSLNEKNWMAAVFLAVCIPDICSSTEERIKGNGPRYRDWFNRYLKAWYNPDSLYDQYHAMSLNLTADLTPRMAEEYKNRPALVTFSAEDCWALRNACLHQGTDESRLRKFKITTPQFEGRHSHFNDIGGVLQLDAEILCTDFIDAARKWMDDSSENLVVKKNLEKMMQIKHSGFFFGQDTEL